MIATIQPGIQSLDFETYLQSAAVSEGDLFYMSQRTPMHLRYAKLHKEETEESPALRFGTVCHRALFEPETMRDAFHVRPEGMKFTTKDGIAWRDTHQDRPILTADEQAALEGIVSSIHSHPTASRMLKNADFERSIFVDDDGVMRKCRPDILPHAGDYLPDLKTCRSAHPDDFAKDIANYGYYRKAAAYLDMCAMAGRKFRAFAFIAVEKTPPYACAVYVMDPEAVEFGRRLHKRDLAVYRECLASNQWPSYSPTPTCIGLPSWLQKQMEQAA